MVKPVGFNIPTIQEGCRTPGVRFMQKKDKIT